MKRYISLALCALAFIGLGSCNKVNETDFDGGSHSVTFRAQLGGDTRTGLALKFVPDWRLTDVSNVHLFETYNGEVTEGEDVEMQTPVDGSYEIAYFTADYGQMTIIVNPPSNAPATRADASGGFTYGGIVAQRENNNYVVPATQYPKAATLIDPNADFLVGHSLQSFPTEQSDKQVNLKFIRPVAISRLSIMNLEGTKVLSVKITSADALVGSATYENINFEEGTVAFTGGSKVLTLDYGTGTAIPAEGIFDAYFISLTGSKRIQKIEVTTDAGLFTKDLGEGKTLTFKVPDFKSIAVNMAGSGSSEPSTDQPQNISFVRGGSKVTTDSYDLYSSAAYVTPTVTGQANGATLTYSSSDEAVATVSVTNGVLVVNPIGTGETTISVRAGAVTGYQAGYAEYTLNVTDSTPEPVSQSLAFVKNGNPITEDSFDLASSAAYVTPTLTGKAEGATVTYAISCIPEGVATIAANGDVTPVAEGVAIITATASAVTGYLETSKSYTLTVTNTTTPEPPVAEATYNYVSGSLSEGTYLIVSYDTNADPVNAVALFPNVVEKSWGGSSPANPGTCITEKEITLDGNNPITTTDAEIVGAEVELIASGSGWKVKAKKTGEYLVSPTSSDINHVYFSTNESDGSVFSAGSVSGNGRSFTVSGSNLYFFHSGSANGFTIRSGSTVSNLRFYKKALKTQTLSFSGETAVYDLNGYSWTTAVPALDKSGAFTDVTYSSSNTAVAMVNATNGAVTIATTAKKSDKAIITATAVENSEYASATATYTISIVDTSTPPAGTATYTKVTSTSDLEAGAQYLVVYEGTQTSADNNKPKVFNPVLNSDGSQFDKATTSALDVEISDGVIASDDLADYLFTLEDGYYLKADKAGKYLYPDVSSSRGYIYAESTPSHALSITFTDGIAEIKTTDGTYYLVWSTSSHYFSSNTPISGSYSTGICLYKLDDDRTPQELSFSDTSAEYDLGTSSWVKDVPSLSGVKTSVTYSSSDETIATVTAAGAVNPLKKGKVTITAKAAGDATYKPGSASYELTVSNSNVPKYVKATSVVAGKEYLIVSNGFALKNNNSSTAGAEAVEVVDGVIMLDAPASILWTATESSGTFTFKNDTRSLARSSTNVQLSTSSSAACSYDATNEYLTTAGSSSTYYFYYSTGNSRWSFSTSQSDTHVAALYRLDDGTTPEPPTPVAQNLLFTPGSVTGKVGETVTAPTLSGAKTPVTYSSSNAAVAEYNASTGILSLKAEGDATITATAVAATVDGVTYAEGKASYTVTVSPADPVQTATYKRISYADGITTGKYLIVNPADAYVFTTSTGTTNAEAVTPASGVLSGDYTAYELTITKNGDNYTIQNSSDLYLYYNYSQGNNQRVGYQTNVNNWTINSVSADAYAFRFTSGSQNIYWNSTYFRIGGSGTDGVHLYKLDDGSVTPDDPEPPTPSTTTYTQITSVSELTDGASYLIVSALASSSSTSPVSTYAHKYIFKGVDDGSVVEVSPAAESGVITGNYSDNEFVLTKKDSNNTYSFAGKNGYLYWRQNGSTSSRYIGIGADSDSNLRLDPDHTKAAGNEAAFFFGADKNNSQSEFLYLNVDQKFKIGGTGSNCGVYLYKKN